MATIAEDLIAFVLGSSDVTALVGQRVHQNRMPERSRYPAVWLQRAAKETDIDHDGQAGITRHTYDVEALGETAADAEDTAAALNSRLAGHRGTFGGRTVQGVFVEDQDEDYERRGNASDEGVEFQALEITIWST